jgi:CheY-like chemotaxis protein
MQMTNNQLVMVITEESEIAQTVAQQFADGVEWIQHGKNALERLKTVEPALVVLDLQLAGFEILDTIRSEDHLASVRVILIIEDVLCIHILGVQVEAELMKPVFAADLIEAITGLSGLSFAVDCQIDSC